MVSIASGNSTAASVLDLCGQGLTGSGDSQTAVTCDASARPAARIAGACLADLTVTELNPDHAKEGTDSIKRLATAITTALGDSATSPNPA